MADLNAAEPAAATARGDALLRGPRAVSAHYDRSRNRVIVELTTGIEIGFAPEHAQGLEHASAADLAAVELEEFGLGLHFPTIDADIYVPSLLKGILGSRSWMAARLGAEGGRARTPAKAAASRANGRRGGRPKAASASP